MICPNGSKPPTSMYIWFYVDVDDVCWLQNMHTYAMYDDAKNQLLNLVLGKL